MRVDAVRNCLKLRGGSARESSICAGFFALSCGLRHPGFAAPLCDAAAVRRLALLILCFGCGAPPQPAVIAPDPPVVKPKRVHRMQPMELVLQGVPALGVRRAIVDRLGEMRMRPDGPSLTSAGWSAAAHDAIAVADVIGDDVRIVHEDDDARMLLWIRRADLARVTVRQVELVRGVIVEPGTRVTDQDHVVLEGVAIQDPVAADAIGDLWEAAPPALREDGNRTLEASVAIRAAPSDHALQLAVTTDRVVVHAEADRDGWLVVDTLGPQVRVHGYVRDLDAGLDTFGTGTGGGYGVSHAITIDVPAGTCLYDAVGGEVIGVITAPRARLANHASESDWFYILVNSPWTLIRVPAHQTGDAFDACVSGP